jgi:hypothetical protein
MKKKIANKSAHLVIYFGNILLLRHAFVHVRPPLVFKSSELCDVLHVTAAANGARVYF